MTNDQVAAAVRQPVTASMADHDDADRPVLGPRGRSLHDSDLSAWLSTLRAKMQAKAAAGVLEHCVVHSSGPGRVSLSFSSAFMSRQCAAPTTLKTLAEAASKTFGGSYIIEVGPLSERASTDSVAADARSSAAAMKAHHESALEQDPDVQRLIGLFGGELVDTIAEIEDPSPVDGS